MENPQPFAGSHVESAQRTLCYCACSSGVMPSRKAAPIITVSFANQRARTWMPISPLVKSGKNVLIVIQLQIHFAVIGE